MEVNSVGSARFRALISVGVVFLLQIATFANSQLNQKRPPKPPSAPLLNVDFGNSGTWSGTAVTGNSATDFWNTYWAPYQSLGQLPDLYWSDGQLSSASVQVQNAPGAWNNGHQDGMMDTFIHSFGYQPIVLTFQNLPNGTYDIYVYAHGEVNQNASVFANSSGVVYGPELTTTGNDWQSTTWVEGSQYVLLKDVGVIGGTALTVTANAWATELAVLNGIQLRQTSTHVKKIKPTRITGPHNGALLNIDLATPTAAPGVAATGNGPADLWNAWYAPFQYYSEIYDLKWSDGAASSVSASIENAPGAWNAGHPSPMMDTFTHSFGYLPINVTLNDLPNGTYDIYVYAHGVLNQNSSISATSGGTVYGPETTTAGIDWLSAVWSEGSQYVLLKDVPVIGGTPLIITSAAVETELAVLNGIQLRLKSQHVQKVKPVATALPPKDSLLNVDFANYVPWQGVAATGNSPTDYWNPWYAPYQTYAEIYDLKWSTGVETSVSASIANAPGAWVSPHPDGMLNTFTHSFGYQPIVLTFTDLPNGTYDVYVYAHGEINQNASITAAADGYTYGPESTTAGDDWLTPGWREGSQYVLLESVSVRGGSPLVITANPGATELAVLSGIQLRYKSKHARKPAILTAPKLPKNALLNVDFANPASWSGVAATGDTISDVWNSWYAPYQLFAERFDLLWANGEASGASATIENAPGAWANGHSNPMMNTFTHSFYYQPINVTFSALPEGTYDVYVYAHGEINQNSQISIQAGGLTYGPEITTSGPGWTSPVWSESAQYVLIPGVKLAAGGTLIVKSEPNAADLAVLNGIQLRRVAKK